MRNLFRHFYQQTASWITLGAGGCGGAQIWCQKSSKVNNDLILTDPVVRSLHANEEPMCINNCENRTDDSDDGEESVLSDAEIKNDNLQSDECRLIWKLTQTRMN